MANPLDILQATTSGKAKKDPSGGLARILEDGRMPPVEIVLKPLNGSPQFKLNRFLSYNFKSSMLVPVDSFSFEFAAPDDEVPPALKIQSGDIVRLEANRKTIATGLIDMVDVETTATDGESVAIQGRDLLSQYEDNDAVSITDDPIWANNYTIRQVVQLLNQNTRISNNIILQDAPSKAYLFATEPTDTKLNAIMRFLEPLNCIFWMSPEGRITIGRPNQAQAAKGRLFLNKAKRLTNVLSMKVTRNTTRVPNIIVPIWSGQEQVQGRTPKAQRLLNAKEDPTRLRKFGHLVVKTSVVSTPQADSAQDLAEINRVQAGGQNLLQAQAKREMARANIYEKIVQVKMAGHYNEAGEPFVKDTVYKIEYDRGNVDENMYLFEVEYSLTEEEGQITMLQFCPLNSIVSDIKAP